MRNIVERQPQSPETVAADAAEVTSEPDRERAWHRHPGLLVAGLVLVAAGIPLAAALVALHQPRWHPVMDLADAELKVRDVGEGHLPLVGAYGRIHAFETQGSHPGPLMFWLLYPLYKLFGSSSWSLQAATATLNLAAVGTAVAIGYRRLGRVGALSIATSLAVLCSAYGANKLTQPWNPFLAALWWVVFLLAVWSLLCKDLAMLPVAVFAGTFCVQAHYGYLGITATVALVAVVVLAVSAYRHRGDRDDGGDQRAPPHRRRLVVWGSLSLVLLGVLWAPPVIEQLTGEPGNLSVLREAIVHPAEEPLLDQPGGLRRTFTTGLAHLNVGTLLSGTRPSISSAPDGPILPGVLLLVVEAAAVLAACRLRQRELLRLHAVVGGALLAGFVSISRIAGEPWDYLLLWAWGTTTLLLVAITWTASVVWKRRSNERLNESRQRAASLVLAVLLVVVSAAFTFDAAYADRSDATALQEELVANLAPDAIAALQDRGGENQRYLVLWHEDALTLGMSGFGLFLELDRHGLDVGVPDYLATEAGGDHRARTPTDTTATIHLVVGSAAIERWQATPGATQLAYYEPRTPAEIDEYDRLYAEVEAGFGAAGREDLVRRLEVAVIAAAINSTSTELRPKLNRMLQLGLPGAVFVAPTEVQPS